MIKKGIILAGGKGTRMSPLTKAVNKQLLPIYDKPLIFYPLSILMLSKIKDILIIVNKGQLNQYKKILPNGKNLGIKITYLEQSKPRGLPDAFVIGKKVKILFVKDRPGHDVRYALNSNKIKSELSWYPKTNISRGIKLTLDWYFENKSYYKSISKKDIVKRLGKS